MKMMRISNDQELHNQRGACVRGGGDIISKAPLFSVIILSYNKETFIQKCLDSVFKQSFVDFEIIVVDDCSCDGTWLYVEQYQTDDLAQNQPPITTIQNKCNQGAFASRIIGENAARGEYFVHIDGDDFIAPNMLEVLFAHIKDSWPDIVGLGHINLDLKGRATFKYPILGEHLIADVVFDLCLATFAYKASIVHKANAFITDTLFDSIPNLNNSEDFLKPFIIAMFAQTYLGVKDALYFVQTNPYSMTADYKSPKTNLARIQETHQIIEAACATLEYRSNSLPREIKPSEIKDFFRPFLLEHHQLYWHSRAYEDGKLTYPLHFLKSLYYTRSIKIACKTCLRIGIFILTFGKLKI